MDGVELVILTRACDAVEIPSGVHRTLAAGTVVRILQHLGDGYTVGTDHGGMYRIDDAYADALGRARTPPEAKPVEGPFREEMVREQLKTVYDPEIPVDIVELGLIYGCEIAPLEDGGKKIHVTMSLTAPGCGMSNVLKADVERKLASLPTVKEVQVDVVFDPPWHPGRMSEAAKLQLGFDM
jgi:probable FeS assembly SUF system protein SufT